MDTSDLFGGAELSSSSSEDGSETPEAKRPREDSPKDVKSEEGTTSAEVTTATKETTVDESAEKITETPSTSAKIEPTVASGRDVFAMALAELELPETGEWTADTMETQVEAIDEAPTALDESINQSFGASESSAVGATEVDGEADDEEEQPTTSQAYDEEEDDFGFQMDPESMDDPARARLILLLGSMSKEQHDRWVMYRRSALPKPQVKRIMLSAVPGKLAVQPTPETVIAVAGMAKLFAGQLIEAALDIKRRCGNSEARNGPITPNQLRLAYMELAAQGKLKPLAGRPKRTG